MLKFESIYYYHDLNYIIIHTNLWGDYWYSGTILLHGRTVINNNVRIIYTFFHGGEGG